MMAQSSHIKTKIEKNMQPHVVFNLRMKDLLFNWEDETSAKERNVVEIKSQEAH